LREEEFELLRNAMRRRGGQGVSVFAREVIWQAFVDRTASPPAKAGKAEETLDVPPELKTQIGRIARDLLELECKVAEYGTLLPSRDHTQRAANP
jgi:hypothetical protein